MNSRRPICKLVLTVNFLLFFTVPSLCAERRVPDGFTFAAAGDLLGPYKPDAAMTDALFATAIKPLTDADAAFANEEGSAFDKETFGGSLGAENGGGYPLHPLPVMREFRRLGIDLLSRANNHAGDYGVEGMLATDRALEAIGFVLAGSGRNLDEARMARYFDSPHGRVGLVAAASTFTGSSPAAGPARGFGPRPGIAVVHNRPITLVTRKEMDALRQIALRGGWQGNATPKPDAKELTLGDALYRVSDRPGLTYEVQPADQKGLIDAVTTARQAADVVVFSIHAHETQSGGYDDIEPADFLPPFFHALIDAGADIVVRHGPHTPLGIEIYKGRPIFYGMGSLVFDLPKSITSASEGTASSRMTVELPRGWFDGAVAVSEFQGGVVKRILVYPLNLEISEGPAHGLPRVAQGNDAKRILAHIAQASARFGTKLVIENGVGVVQVQH